MTLGSLGISTSGEIDVTNSSSTALLAGAVFTGETKDVTNFALILVTVFSDVASATNGLVGQVSTDGVTWRNAETYTTVAGVEKTYTFQPSKHFFRIQFTNGGTDQTIFDLQTVLKRTGSSLDGQTVNASPVGLSVDHKNTVMDVSTTAVAMPMTPLTGRNSLAIRNLSLTETLYIGKSDVTADTVNGNTSGWQVGPNETYNVDITSEIIIYGRTSSGSIKVQTRELA